MPIQVIIKRKWQTDNPEALFPLLTELRSLAKKQPGYISGETLRSLDG
jgi:antibiotic biosynthesis monooxygenase (ABM) superfamily enzyme